MMNYYDVIIVGAGHSGLQCGAELAVKGLKVLIVEKKKRPAGNTSSWPRVISERTRLMLDLPDDLLETQHAQIILNSSRKQYAKRRENCFAYTVHQNKLLAHQWAHAENAGARIMAGEQVSTIKKRYVLLNSGERIKCSYIVGADGADSMIRRHLGLPMKQAGKIVNVLLDGPTDSHVEYYYNTKVFKYGCGWRLPFDGRCVYGAMIRRSASTIEKHGAQIFNWIKEVQGARTTLRQQESGSVNCHFSGFRFGRIFLAGDAAGLACPYTGHGIDAAIESGRGIAQLIINPMKRSSPVHQIVDQNKKFYRMIRRLAGDQADDDVIERRLMAHHFGY